MKKPEWVDSMNKVIESVDVDDAKLGEDYTTTVWYSHYRPKVTLDECKKITEQASKFTMLRLLFRRSSYSIDGDVVIRYKELNGVVYVIKRGSRGLDNV